MISLSGMKHAAQTYKSFPMYNLPASIVNTMSLQLPPIMFLAIYDAQTAGLYALAHMLVVQPGSVISESMGQAFLGEASKMVREKSNELSSLYIRTLKDLFSIGVPLIGIPAMFAPFIMPIIFGEAWAEAGWYCWPLGLMVIVGFAASPTSKLTIYGYNHWQLMWDVIRVFAILLGFYGCLLLGLSVIYTLTVYAMICVVLYFKLIYLNILAINRLENRLKP